MGDLNEKIIPGDPILASTWEAIRQVAAKFAKIRVTAPLELVTGTSGTMLRLTGGESFWAKITGSSGTYYSWTEQIPQNGGTWTNGTRTGTTGRFPGVEVNNNTSVPAGTYVWLTMDSTRTAYHFIYSACSS